MTFSLYKKKSGKSPVTPFISFCLNKKEELGIVSRKINRRRFNPRLPIPTIDTFKKFNNKDDVDANSEDQFPSLDKSIDV